jgi:hypothetical protein
MKIIFLQEPLYLPADFALAIPSLWRSSIISRSNLATPPNTVSISLPVLNSVSKPRMLSVRAVYVLSSLQLGKGVLSLLAKSASFRPGIRCSHSTAWRRW